MSDGTNSHSFAPVPGSIAIVRPYVVVTKMTSRTRLPTRTPWSSTADESTVPSTWTRRRDERADVAGGDAGVGGPDAAALGVEVKSLPVGARDPRRARAERRATRARAARRRARRCPRLEPPHAAIASAHSAAVPAAIVRALTTASIPGPSSSASMLPTGPRQADRVAAAACLGTIAFRDVPCRFPIQVCSVFRSFARSALR